MYIWYLWHKACLKQYNWKQLTQQIFLPCVLLSFLAPSAIWAPDLSQRSSPPHLIQKPDSDRLSPPLKSVWAVFQRECGKSAQNPKMHIARHLLVQIQYCEVSISRSTNTNTRVTKESLPHLTKGFQMYFELNFQLFSQGTREIGSIWSPMVIWHHHQIIWYQRHSCDTCVAFV